MTSSTSPAIWTQVFNPPGSQPQPPHTHLKIRAPGPAPTSERANPGWS